MEIIRIKETDSTNRWVADHEGELSLPTLVACHTQTAGRGQRGNSWESQSGKNITASLIFRPDNCAVHEQFAISEGIALAITDFLREEGVDAKVKWPNDIYAGDRKICGILVEHVVTGKEITRTIAGMGVNINQMQFLSDAPNPVSLQQLTGREYSIEKSIGKLATHLEKYLCRLEGKEELHEEFCRRLWRNDGRDHAFRDNKNKEEILARIEGVGLDGTLHLLTDKGERRSYLFKEIEFLL